jgi:hypothetical protein
MLTRRIITLVLSLVTMAGIAAGTAGAAGAATRHNPPPAAFTRVHNPSASTIA